MSPVNKKRPLSLKIYPELWKAAYEKAKAQGRTLTNYLERLIANDTKTKEPKK
jgi:hypothetical protein